MRNTHKDRIRAIQGTRNIEADRIAYSVAHMDQNRAYRAALAGRPGQDAAALLEEFRQRFIAYRLAWQDNPKQAFEKGWSDPGSHGLGHLSVDLETSAMCDLACPFCYRQSIATPDKIAKFELCKQVIDQAAELGVPSMKFNWRGEPLLHPNLPELIAYAKDRGILDTIINTNAVTLNEDKRRALIEAGLDFMIYSFDGGSKETYERMRPGRFAPNSFDRVYANIRAFAEIRNKMGARFPRTKIQMVLTRETFPEKEDFFHLFSECVDDVSVKAYTERGGSLSDLDEASRGKVAAFLKKKGLPSETPYLRDTDGKIFVSAGRLPCEQPFQRMLVTWDGQVCMCCYDWGIEHPIGLIAPQEEEIGIDACARVVERARQGRAGYEFLKRVRIPHPHTRPKRVQALKDIWQGELVNTVREKHVLGRLPEVAVCRSCPFKETYDWIPIPEEE